MKQPVAIFFALALLAGLPNAEAQQAGKLWRIGLMRNSPPPPVNLAEFRKGLRELGHVEGKSYVLVPAWAKGKKKRRAAAAALARTVDVILTEGTRITRAAMNAKPTVPVVFASTKNPVGDGLVQSLSRPGGNVTGITSGSQAMSSKRFQILKELVPGIHRMARLRFRPKGYRPGAPANKRIAAALGVGLLNLQGSNIDELVAVYDNAAATGINGIQDRSTPSLTGEERKRLVEAAARTGIPTIYGAKAMVRMGGLISYATNRAAQYHRAATFVHKILKGAKPADLPVEQPTKIEMVVNLKTAKALGITIPPSVLLRADEVIE